MIQVCLWPHQHPLSLKSCQIFWLRAQNISSDGSSGVEAETDGEAAIVAQERCMEIGQICVCVCVCVRAWYSITYRDINTVDVGTWLSE